MKAIRIFFRSIRDAVKSIGRNFSLSMASILCVTITLIIVSFAMIITANVNNATKNIEEEMNIVVYLQKDVTDEDIDNMESEITNIIGVKEIKFVSKEEQKNNMSEYNSAFETILNYLDDNPLLDSYVVFVNDVKEISEVAKQIDDLPKVETTKYGEGMVEEVVSAFDIIQKGTIAIVIALVLVTVFLIGNTIKLTIYSRRNEIEIMRLVGASNSAIKLPFIFEGLMLGIIGSIIPVCITIYGYVILYNTMHGYLFSEMLRLVEPYNFVFWVSGTLVVIGAVVGMFGSSRSVRKYLKI
ncbi:MAG: permease-like cell division protein FtsX [Bacilli bacterium]|nr:permease-like cell division protein FtsX [Bacilli bacterium]